MKDRSMYDQNPSIFQQFVSLTTQKQIMIEKVIKKIRINYPNKKVRFLDIGCADGSVTIPIIEQLNNIITTGIEASSALINDFKRKTSISVEFINKNVELLDALPNSDFILISHVLPYINDLNDFVDKVLKALNKNGMALIVINNPLSDDVKVKKRILNQEKYTSLSSNMQKLLKEKKVLFDTEVVESTIDVSGMSKMNNDGKSIIEFFYHEKYEDISNDNIESMRNLILNYSNEDNKLVKREDYLWISK
ncbi:MAG: class I SAM-dependent methyltransferase [Bacilli bacterium]|nr:class I SAM-dependent methyltransferase [Bacilli bacterium]